MSDKGLKLQTIKLPAGITVRELALALKASPIEVIKILMSNGVMASINQATTQSVAGTNQVKQEIGHLNQLALGLRRMVETKVTGSAEAFATADREVCVS